MGGVTVYYGLLVVVYREGLFVNSQNSRIIYKHVWFKGVVKEYIYILSEYYSLFSIYVTGLVN